MVGRAVAEAAPRNGLANGDLLHVYLNAYVKFEANYYRPLLFCINTSQCPSLMTVRPGLWRKGSLQSPRQTPFVPSHSITIIIARMPWHIPTDDFQRIVFVLAWHWFPLLGRLPCFADIFSECLNKSCPTPVRSKCWWCLASLDIITYVTLTTALASSYISQVETESGRN